MRPHRPHLAIAIALVAAAACHPDPPTPAGSARFTAFTYEGRDARFMQDIDPRTQYFNPVIAGFYPDPSVCACNDRYYLVNSSFGFYPGIPLWESTDLVSWQQVGHVLTRDEQLDVRRSHPSAGIYAPAISYCQANQTLYVVTMNMYNYRVFYVKTQDPAQGWSDPVYLKQGGMDPSLFFDDDGRAYMVYNSRPTGGSKYPGETSIFMSEIDLEGDSVVGERREIVRGGIRIDSQEPRDIEGPHLYKEGGYYYLMCAQGGTGTDHCEVVFRTRDLHSGLWEPLRDPILAQPQGGTDQYPVSSTGHADLVRTADGSWWAVFLACRPYEGDLYHTGRETFLLPVTWREGWPRILAPDQPLPTVATKPELDTLRPRPTGNFAFTDSFAGTDLDQRWVYLRNPEPERYTIDGKGLLITPDSVNIYQDRHPAAVFCRQSHTCFTASTVVDFHPRSSDELAGLVLLQDAQHCLVLGKTLVDGQPAITLTRSGGGHDAYSTATEDADPVAVEDADPATAEDAEPTAPAVLATAHLTAQEAAQPLRLIVEGNGGSYSFSYQTEGHAVRPVATDVDATCLSTHRAGGYIGTMLGLYATLHKD